MPAATPSPIPAAAPLQTPAATAVRARIGTGPEPFKDVDDEQLAEWGIEEADKIEKLANDTIRQNSVSPRAINWRFTQDFNRCCADDLKNLRSEILERLGPPGKDPDEIMWWEMLFPPSNSPFTRATQDEVSLMTATEYAGHLRRLARSLKRKASPLKAPKLLSFVQQVQPPDDKFAFNLVVAITTDKAIRDGVIVVEFDAPYASGSTDFVGSKLLSGKTDNDELNLYLERLMKEQKGYYAIQIGSNPFMPDRAVRVFASGSKPVHAVHAVLFDL